MKFERTTIDSHVHVGTFYDSNGTDFYTFFDSRQNELGLKGLNICCCPIYSDWSIENNIMAALYKLHNPTAYAYGGFFYPDKPIKLPLPDGLDILTQYNELMDMGFDGIKMLETKALEQKEYNVRVNADYYEDFFAKCEKDGTHLVWHVADPDTFWDINRIPARHLAKGWYYGDGTYMKWEEIYKTVFDVLERHPKLIVNFAHFFFYSEHPEWLEELFDKYENVGIDITPGAEMYNAFRDNNEFYREFFIKYADRINYGTDLQFPTSVTNVLRNEMVYRFLTTDENLKVVDIETKGLNLPSDVSDKILCSNFEKRAGEKPRAIDVDKFKAYVKKYRKYITKQDVLTDLMKKGYID